MSYNTLITIITPTFNSGAIISRLISSIQSQDFREFEHLIIDGESTDNTIDVITRYAAESSNVKLSIAKDNGIYDAMNKGISMAKGSWIFFIGADDYLYGPNVLKDIAQVINIKKDLDLD
jgi:glycosyltransferase involved in cell wall biosynthesis